MSIPIALRGISMRRGCAAWRGRRRMDLRRGGFWRWRRFTTARTRTEAAKIGGVGLQIVRDWVVRFNAAGRTACSTARRRASPRGSMMRIAGRLAR